MSFTFWLNKYPFKAKIPKKLKKATCNFRGAPQKVPFLKRRGFSTLQFKCYQKSEIEARLKKTFIWGLQKLSDKTRIGQFASALSSNSATKIFSERVFKIVKKTKLENRIHEVALVDRVTLIFTFLVNDKNSQNQKN